MATDGDTGRRAIMGRRFLLQAAGGGFAAASAAGVRAATMPASLPVGAAVADMLADAMIWAADPGPEVALSSGPEGNFTEAAKRAGDRHANFRRSFRLDAAPPAAMLHLFAYTRYRLYVNGRYVGRGPARFENGRPEYDSWDVAGLLRAGDNSIAVLVHRDAPTGRIMLHEPGFAAMLAWAEGGRARQIVTDEEWRARVDRSFGPRPLAWSSIEERIDARLSDDWLAAEYRAADWPAAVAVTGADAPLMPRSIPLLRETALRPDVQGGRILPLALRPGAPTTLRLDRLALAYHRLTIDASAGTVIEVRARDADNAVTGTNRYICRAGVQSWDGGDVFATQTLEMVVTGGSATLRAAALIEVLYPYEQLGRFDCDDPFLNRLYAMGARSIELLSEDAYTDCADRERVEWMDCSPPGFDVSRVMMAGRNADGSLTHSDPRLLRGLLLRTALTQRADGMMKAHTCSERWDIHAIMEDRMCPWVTGLRLYHEATGDDAFVQMLWPRLERLMAWFLGHRTPRGLVLAREWEVWDNPLRYQLCEGMGLNALVVRALKDAAHLATAIGKADRARFHADAAARLSAAINAHLWDEAAGAYHGGLFGPGSERRTQLNDVMFNGPLDQGRFRPTLIGMLYALDAGLVPADRRARATAWMLAHLDEAISPMSNHLVFHALYALDGADHDATAIARMRAKWRAMVKWRGGTSWETLDYAGGSRVHVYGVSPVYFLAAFVLGVRPAPIGERRLVIDPRPGGLQRAGGVVETEYGPVPVRWRYEAGAFHLNGAIPRGVRATAKLPRPAHDACIMAGKRTIRARAGERIALSLDAGPFSIVMSPA